MQTKKIHKTKKNIHRKFENAAGNKSKIVPFLQELFPVKVRKLRQQPKLNRKLLVKTNSTFFISRQDALTTYQFSDYIYI